MDARAPGFDHGARRPLVGRERELERFDREIAATLDGAPRFLLCSGEAGIGKTRMLVELAARFDAAGGRVAFGRCLDEAGMPPFLPWIAIGGVLATPGEAAIADRLLDADDQPTGTLDPGRRRFRLYGAVCAVLAQHLADRPLLLALDDLQWSDPASNQLLRYVLAHLSAAPLLIAGAFRPREGRENAELAKTIAEAERARILAQIPLGPLPEPAISELVSGLTGESDPAATATIAAVSGGNPFVVEELVRAGAGTVGALAPDGVGAVIARRLASRTPACREALELAAVAGRDIDAELVAAVLGRDLAAIVDALEEATAAALVVPVAGNDPTGADYAFAHDRIREAVAEAIPLAKRRSFHGRIADVLEADHAAATPARLARLAHHLEAARRPNAATAALVRLGDADLAIGAYEDAALAFARARAHGPVEATLLLKLGDARLHAGQPDASDAYADAERAFAAAGHRAGVARALQRRGIAHARREELEPAVACLRAAAAAWEGIDPTGPDAAATWTELCAVLGTGLGQYGDALAAGERALAAAADQPERPELAASARLAQAQAQIRSGDLVEGARSLEPALSLALQAHAPDLAAEIAGTLANQAYWTGDLAASERYARWRRELGIESRDPYALRHTLPWLANVAMARGRWDDALALIAEAEADLARIDSPEPRAFLRQLTGMIALQRGDAEGAVAALEAATGSFRAIGPGALPWYLGVLAAAYHAAGAEAELARTVAETGAVVGALPSGALPRAPSIAQLAMIAVLTGDRPAMTRWAEALTPYGGQHHWVLMDRARGMLAASLGDAAAAERYLAAAIATATRGGIEPELLLARAELAHLRGDAAAIRRTAAAMTALGMAVPPRYRPADAPRSLPAGLTEREAEVLALVAQGCTNREIGERLFISEKTVTNHLTHVFTKANLENRAAAAAFAHRHRLVE